MSFKKTLMHRRTRELSLLLTYILFSEIVGGGVNHGQSWS